MVQCCERRSPFAVNRSPGALSLNFRSDNVATVTPEILRALEAVNHGPAASYGDDEYTALLNRKFSDLFETAVTVLRVSTGTAANALVTVGCSPAEMTWRSGVDILSFGATKNGAMGADAIVVFNQALVEPLSYRLRRAGQTWSKMRFAAAQLIAYVEDGLFLRLASHANALASQLGRDLAALPGTRLITPVEANLVFVTMPEPAIEALAGAGVRFARRRGGVIRLVTRFDGTQAEVTQLIALARQALA